MISESDKKKAEEKNIVIEYSDDDIVIMDSIKDLKAGRTKRVRVPVNIILLCTNGIGQVEINGCKFELRKNDILIMPPNTFTDNAMSSDDFACRIMVLTNRIIHAFLRPHVNIWNQVLYSNKARVRAIKSPDANASVKFYELINMLKHLENNKYKNLIMQSLIKGTILAICGSLEKSSCNEDECCSQGDIIFRHFLDLLDSNKTKRQTVEYYANKLFITPKYLSVICKNTSGKTAMQWIHEYVNEDIRYYLKQTDLSIKEITDVLGFPNASFFGRYVRQHFGVSPKQFRTQHLVNRIK